MTILGKAKVDEQTRHDLVYAWTQGRTDSTKDLFEKELDDILWKLQNDSFFAGNIPHTTNAMMELELKRKRSNVLAIAQRCGLHEGTSFEKFNGFMEKCSIHKKRLNKYTIDELDELLKQMRKLEANFKASAQKAGTKAWHEHFGIPQSSDN